MLVQAMMVQELVLTPPSLEYPLSCSVMVRQSNNGYVDWTSEIALLTWRLSASSVTGIYFLIPRRLQISSQFANYHLLQISWIRKLSTNSSSSISLKAAIFFLISRQHIASLRPSWVLPKLQLNKTVRSVLLFFFSVFEENEKWIRNI